MGTDYRPWPFYLILLWSLAFGRDTWPADNQLTEGEKQAGWFKNIKLLAQTPPAALAEFFTPPEKYRSDLGRFRSALTFADGTPVRDAADWKRRREKILATWHQLMGPWPPLIQNPRVEVVNTIHRENIAQHQLRVEIALGGEMVEALLLVPDAELPARKRPAVLVVLVELHALMAPRPFLVSGGTADLPERWPALNHAIAVNRLLGYAHRVAMTQRDGHTPTPAANEQAYRFLEWCLNDAK